MAMVKVVGPGEDLIEPDEDKGKGEDEGKRKGEDEGNVDHDGEYDGNRREVQAEGKGEGRCLLPQFGLAADPRLTRKWTHHIKDEPVGGSE